MSLTKKARHETPIGLRKARATETPPVLSGMLTTPSADVVKKTKVKTKKRRK